MIRAFFGSLVLMTLMAAPALAVDVLELLSGAKVQGEITARTEKTISMKVIISGVTLNRSYAVSSVHAITSSDGTRTVINEKGSAPATPPGTPSTPNATTKPAPGIRPTPAAGGGSRAQLDKLIDDVGKTPPDWFEEAKLNYPMSLDLTWPVGAPPGGGWNNQKNVGQFLWDIIYPNPSRWKEGVKLLHHLLTMHKDDKEKTERHMLTLGNMYHNLHEDYGRAAFWFRAAGVERSPDKFPQAVHTLAECYWKLGYRSEALILIGKSPTTFPLAKLLADMGETDRALQICGSGAKSHPAESHLYAGDACRVAGRYPQALVHYQKVLDVPVPANPGRLKQYRERATANVEAIKAYELFDLKKIADGNYQSASQGYEGPVEVSVTVARGKITDVKVTNHKEKQFRT
jgi:hypothetical protein